MIEALIRIYSYDVDFQHKAQPGDSFDVLYSQDDENDVMFAALTTGGEAKKYYQFKTTDDGIVDYYDETGKSAKFHARGGRIEMIESRNARRMNSIRGDGKSVQGNRRQWCWESR